MALSPLPAKLSRYAPGALLIAFFLFWSFLFLASSPDQIIAYVGVENAYLLIFVLALIGGLTTFSGVPYHLVLVTLAVGGLNPLLLGVVTACGVMLGDSTSYFIGYQGALLIPKRMHAMAERFFSVKERYPRLLPVLFFIYGSSVPFSNDIITIPMGFLRYPFWRVMLPLGLGNLVFNVTLAFLAIYAYGALATLTFLGR